MAALSVRLARFAGGSDMAELLGGKWDDRRQGLVRRTRSKGYDVEAQKLRCSNFHVIARQTPSKLNSGRFMLIRLSPWLCLRRPFKYLKIDTHNSSL